jgi:CheY-like chemotaxis protein
MFEKRKILFVEDDQSEIKSISSLLKILKADFAHAATVSDALRDLSRYPFDYVLTNP